jgi:transcriptional regulator with XRE-family HTH domain
MKDYGTKLKQLLIAKNIKQVELAEAIHSNPKNINSYITGRAEPPLEIVVKIAKYLDVPLDYFLGDTELNDALEPRYHEKSLNKLESTLPHSSYKLVEFILLLQNKHIERLLDVVKDLDSDSLCEIVKQAEKEKCYKNYQNATHK